MNWNNIIYKYNILNIYPFGSQIYGTSNNSSDYDFILVNKNYSKVIRENYFYDNKKYNLNIIPLDIFINQLNEHKISLLECIYLIPSQIIKQDYQFNFKLDKKKLFLYIERKSQEDFSKAFKYKDSIEWKNKKFIFHSLRMIDFAIDIIKNNSINYLSCKNLFLELKNNELKDYNFYHDKYSLIYKNRLDVLSKLSKGK